MGITELEELGIYHADLQIRNTIRVSHSGKYVFKIIDFDKAFKVTPSKTNDKAYQCTKDLIDFLLKFHFDQRKPRAPLDELSMSQFQDYCNHLIMNDNNTNIFQYYIYYPDRAQGFESEETSSSNLTGTKYDETEIIKYIFRDAQQQQGLIDQLLNIKDHAKFSPHRNSKCLILLRNYMHKSHLKQYTSL